jgi:DNA-binding LacI/PurR family transcriptional regulator
VIKALRELQLSGVIERRAGSGSYVRADAAARGYTFGLLIPELGRTEIFEPICRGMAEAQHGGHHVLLWGSSFGDEANIEVQAYAGMQAAHREVSGVFFAPLELTPRRNRLIEVSRNCSTRQAYPLFCSTGICFRIGRTGMTWSGSIIVRAGYVVTGHLINGGCRRIVFLGRPGSAPTVDARIAGYKRAIAESKLPSGPHVLRMDPENQAEVKKVMTRLRPEAFVCANDFTAAHLLKTLTDLKINVPGDVRMVGIDDVKYASLLSVPLTTIHQPCASIGAIAVGAMLDRLRDPNLPARDISLSFHLVVRESCGTRKKRLTRAS